MKGNIRETASKIMIAGFVIIWVVFVGCAVAGLIWGLISLGRAISLRPAKAQTMAADVPAEGIGRVPTVERYLGGEDAEAVPSLWVVCEDDPDLPEWWDPDSAVLVYTDAPKKDIGCPDWNVDSTLWEWDGHGMEAWEMELFSRIFYREFWQPNLTLCEAGCDAMLGLWDLYGGTLFETLSHVNEDGSYTFSTYPGVWEIEYDPDGLAWCKAFCEERFYEGPVWPAQYFRKGQYHDWGEWSPIPAYEIDGIYFSIGKEQ